MFRSHGRASNYTMVSFQMNDEAAGDPGYTYYACYALNFTAGQLMHLALSWNKEWGQEGLKIFKDGVEAPHVYADGPVRGEGDIRPAIDAIRRRLPALTYDLALLRFPRRPDGGAPQFDKGMYLENLKIWDYAKTNFADRLNK